MALRMTFLRRLFPVSALAVFVLLAACGNDAKKEEAAKSIDDRFAIKVGDRVVQLQLALLPAEQQRGRMFRRTMGAEEGMIFVFRHPQTMSFWMRNTELPLDIGYFDADGTLREVYPMYPHDEKSVPSVGKRQLALEMNQGWYARAGVKPGAKLDMKALRDAMRARGVRPEMYELK
jgi:uncharacterized membrane protein (UPF0127 family)